MTPVQAEMDAEDVDLNGRLLSLESRLNELQSVPQQVSALQSVPQLLDSALEALASIAKRLQDPTPPSPPPPGDVFHSSSVKRAIKRAKERNPTSHSTSSGEKSSCEAVMPLIGQPATVTRSNPGDGGSIILSHRTPSHQHPPCNLQRRPSNASILQRRPSNASISSHKKMPSADVPYHRRPSDCSIISNSISVCSGHSRHDLGVLGGLQRSDAGVLGGHQRGDTGTCSGQLKSDTNEEAFAAHILPGIAGADEQTDEPLPPPRQAEEMALSDPLSRNVSDDAIALSPINSIDYEGDPGRPRVDHRSMSTIMSLASGTTNSQEGLACMAGILHRTYEESVPWCIMPPLGLPRLLWDALVLLATVVTGIAVPMSFVSLGKGRPLCCFVKSLMCAIDAVWLIDVLANFRTGFFHGVGGSRQVLNPRRIAVRYVKGWLALDLLAAWPLALSPAGQIGSFSLVSFLVLALKLLRVVRLWPMLAKLQKKCRHVLFLAAQVALGLLFLSHFMACMWRLAQKGTVDEMEFESSYSFDLYVQDMYWVVMTMTTVGYGDVQGRGTLARLYAIVVMLTAPMYFGSIVSLLTHAMSRLIDSRTEASVVEAKRFMRSRRVPLELQRRVVHNLRHNLHQERLASLDPSLLTHLSPAVQRELSLALLSRTVLKFPLFRGVTYSFVADLAQVHTWVQCLPGDLVVEEGQLEQEVVFVVHGRLLLQGGNEAPSSWDDLDAEHQGVQKDSVFENIPATDTICAGAWFGEACLFDRAHVRTTTVIALAESELAVLAAADFFRIMEKYPRLQHRHRALETAILEKRLHLWELAYRIPERRRCHLGCLVERRDSMSSGSDYAVV